MAQLGSPRVRSSVGTSVGRGATNGTRSGVLLFSTAGHPSQADDVPSKQRPDDSRVPVRNAPGTATVDVGGTRLLPTVSGQPRQTVRGRDRQASFLGGAEDDESSFLASAGESEYTVIDRAPNSVDRYQLFDTPIGGSQRLSEEALRRHNEVMSPDFGRMRAMGQDAIRSVSQASSRRTTASIARIEDRLERNQQAVERNQQMMEQVRYSRGLHLWPVAILSDRQRPLLRRLVIVVRRVHQPCHLLF